ncbi:MAG: prepilin-type N-terminal cleavage/methylation domain-containing protein [Deltaproteobacteria bacterium]|nr:prepilin-type N-terminal cleavage/methylation domain-containing protein [Deltaproteobacteria bacterium]
MERRSQTGGYTLIELMIVLAIIGVLVVLASSIVITFQTRSKQAEVKTNLAAIGNTAETYFTEKDTYATDFNGLGWGPQGLTRYSYFYGTDTRARTHPDIPDTTGTVPAGVAASSTSFTAGASANLDADPTIDQWTYNNQRVLVNVVNDATQ